MLTSPSRNTLELFIICAETIGFLCGSLRITIAQEDLSSVTTLIGSENLFVDLRRLKAQNYDDHEDPEILPEACASIISGGFFVDECHLTNPPEHVKAVHLKQLQFRNASLDPYTYVSRNISFRDRVLAEKVFSCFAWSNRTNSVLEYLISREYNWNWDWRSRVRVVAVQMGHGRVGNESAAALIAMAERPARVTFDFGELYESNEMDKKYEIIEDKFYEHETGDEDEGDNDGFFVETTMATEKPRVDDGDEGSEMCGTTLEQRVRLCSGMLHAEVYRGKILYSPYEEDRYTLKSLPACRKYDLLFKHNKTETVVPKWVIQCDAVDLGSMKPTMYGISIGARSDHFLISELSTDPKVISAHCDYLWP